MSRGSFAEQEDDLQAVRTLFCEFAFFKVDRSFRSLPKDERTSNSNQFLAIMEQHAGNVTIRSYSTVGLRRDADFMLWMVAGNVDFFQDLVRDLNNSGLGRYLEIPYSWLSMTRPSMYTKQHLTSFELGEKPSKYAIVYPFVKTRDWYLLPFDERKMMMEEHGRVGRMFPKVKLNTTYSFGLDDQDFMLAFETDDLQQFQELIMKLRSTEASRYIARDTPMIVSRLAELREILGSLGGY